MSCKKEGCCRRELPRADMMAIPDWVINQLLTLAHTGFKNMIPWPNDSVCVLAEKIAALVAENDMLRKLLDRDKKPNPVVDGDTFEFTFGPENQYTLQIPVSSANTRKQLAKGLTAAAAELATERVKALPDQLDLPFDQ